VSRPREAVIGAIIPPKIGRNVAAPSPGHDQLLSAVPPSRCRDWCVCSTTFQVVRRHTVAVPRRARAPGGEEAALGVALRASPEAPRGTSVRGMKGQRSNPRAAVLRATIAHPGPRRW
jgi:hypothetical protein